MDGGYIPIFWVKLSVFERVTGYTPDSVDKKIKRGVWREGVHFVRAPDGHILMSLPAYNAWAENRPLAA